MDWNRTKTIFIIVFSILNVFLYTLYVDRLTGAKDLETLIAPDVNIEEKLEQDRIFIESLPPKVEELGYVSGKLKVFTKKEIDSLANQTAVVTDGTRILSTLKKPLKLSEENEEESYKEFLDSYVLSGNQYVLWEVDEEQGEAMFLQKVEDRPIYYTQSLLTVHFNQANEIIRYEQRMFEDFEEFNTTKNIVQPTTALNTLYTREMLKQDSEISSIDLGYSTLVQLTETQVFAPTWHIQVKLADGQFDHFFINAVEGKVIELQEDEQQDGEE
ncbi:two-component system regulatory protein YycI [Chungangia koreensis]|uniref:Two-component system regulatory protein YycI n=1 Tax=Chungangia koreensis TaxID=752657 RepID=A0ABV8X986_9LACT